MQSLSIQTDQRSIPCGVPLLSISMSSGLMFAVSSTSCVSSICPSAASPCLLTSSSPDASHRHPPCYSTGGEAIMTRTRASARRSRPRLPQASPSAFLFHRHRSAARIEGLPQQQPRRVPCPLVKRPVSRTPAACPSSYRPGCPLSPPQR